MSALSCVTRVSVPKPIDCYNCDSREQHFCNDKFNKTDAVSLRHMKKCEGECLKWVRQVDPTDRKYILRTRGNTKLYDHCYFAALELYAQHANNSKNYATVLL